MFVTNMGWQLSFASFGGIMILSPKVTRFFYGDKKPNFVARSIITSSVATLITLPITIFYFDSFSLITILANLIILPTLPFTIGLLFMTGVLAGIPMVSAAVAFVTTRLLDFHILIVKFFAEQKYFLVEVPKRNGWVFLIYAPIAIILLASIFARRRKT
jgi:competence protein ComEC